MEKKTTQPPFTAAMIEGLTDLIQKKLGDPPYMWDSVLRVFYETTSYKRKTSLNHYRRPPQLFNQMLKKLESRGCIIHYSERTDGN